MIKDKKKENDSLQKSLRQIEGAIGELTETLG